MRIRFGAAFLAMTLFAAPAFAQAPPAAAEPVSEAVAEPVQPSAPEAEPVQPPAPDAEPRAAEPTLAELVAAHAGTLTPDEESECLARAVYWESRGEPLAGQLAVAEVVINRARSGRFAPTLCGVVRQRGQFSFVRGGVIPTPPRASRDWRTAVAIAQIATRDLADGAAPRALFFHARHVSPGWRRTRVATVGNHIFYR